MRKLKISPGESRGEWGDVRGSILIAHLLIVPQDKADGEPVL